MFLSKKLLGPRCVYVCEVAQLCPTLWDPMDCSIPGSSVHRIFQARVLEWVAISFSRESSQPRDQTQVSCILYIDRQILYHCATWETQLQHFLIEVYSPLIADCSLLVQSVGFSISINTSYWLLINP